MPHSDPDDQPAKPNRDWIDKTNLVVSILTFGVLTATLVAVIKYTREAHRQNTLARQALEVTSRPVLSVGFQPPQTPQVGAPLRVPVFIINLGKRPAKAHFRAIVVYSLDKLSAPELPTEETWPSHLIWPLESMHDRIDAFSHDKLTHGQYDDMRTGRGWIYVRARVDYGLDYFTMVCAEFKLVAATTGNGLPSLDKSNICDHSEYDKAN